MRAQVNLGVIYTHINIYICVCVCVCVYIYIRPKFKIYDL